MTSLLQPPVLPSFELARSQCGITEGRYRQSYLPDRIKSSRCAQKPWGSDFKEGLPTPPGSKAMTDISTQNTQTSNFGGHAFYEPIRHNQHGISNGTTGWNTNQGVTNEFLDGTTAEEVSKDGSDNNRETKKGSNQSIASFLRIPEAIDPSGGSLTELAAEVCLTTPKGTVSGEKLTTDRSLVSFGSSQPRSFIKLNKARWMLRY